MYNKSDIDFIIAVFINFETTYKNLLAKFDKFSNLVLSVLDF